MAALTTVATAAGPDLTQLGQLFNTVRFGVPAFSTLGSRGCLPANFSLPDFVPALASKCTKEAMESNYFNPDVPIRAFFYVCLGFGLNVVKYASFDVATLEDFYRTFSPDPAWPPLQRSLSAACQAATDAGLTPTQQSVFYFTCWLWSLYLDCELRKSGDLSGVASCRRARFLAGTCPLSPRTLLSSFGPVGNRWQQCSGGETISVGNETESECRELDAAVTRQFSCMLQDYIKPYGTFNFGRLLSDINTSPGDHPGKDELRKIVEECVSSHTVTEFLTCWTRHGIFSCAASEANQLALKVRE